MIQPTRPDIIIDKLTQSYAAATKEGDSKKLALNRESRMSYLNSLHGYKSEDKYSPWKVQQEVEDWASLCICGKQIERTFIVESKVDSTISIIFGIDCIKKIMPDEASAFAKICPLCKGEKATTHTYCCRDICLIKQDGFSELQTYFKDKYDDIMTKDQLIVYIRSKMDITVDIDHKVLSVILKHFKLIKSNEGYVSTIRPVKKRCAGLSCNAKIDDKYKYCFKCFRANAPLRRK
jgi:hypothetical protein